MATKSEGLHSTYLMYISLNVSPQSCGSPAIRYELPGPATCQLFAVKCQPALCVPFPFLTCLSLKIKYDAKIFLGVLMACNGFYLILLSGISNISLPLSSLKKMHRYVHCTPICFEIGSYYTNYCSYYIAYTSLTIFHKFSH